MGAEANKYFDAGRSAISRTLAFIGLVGLSFGVGYYGQEDRYDWAGDLHRRRTDTEVDIEVRKAARRLYDASDAVGKYILSYLAPGGSTKEVSVGTLEGGKGILGKIDTFFRGDSLAELSHDIGQVCLTETAYDILRPELRQRSNPTASPAQLIEFGQTIVVLPSDKSLPLLQFMYNAENVSLVPNDETTRTMLSDNGCYHPR